MASELLPRLLARIQRKYRLNTLPLEFGPIKIEFTRIADPNRVLDELAEAEDRREKLEGLRREGDELHLPYWAELWDSSVALCEQLAEESAKVKGKSLLDLGCGMGLVGTVAAALGAHVTLADLESDALLLSRLNAMRFDSCVQTIRLNWRVDRLSERFDWIIGADIIYERAQWEFLEKFWREHLKESGVVLIGEPFRPGGDPFAKWITNLGWKIEVTERIAQKFQKRIRIIRLTK